MANISFTKVNLPYGWLGNMSPSPIVFDDVRWNTLEALFQALRFDDLDIRENIRSQASPMSAKMIAKANKDKYIIEPMSEEDINNMRLCLELKFSQNIELKEKLLRTGDHYLYEDIGSRRGKRHEFWGAYKNKNNEWVGTNMMGKLLMELRMKLKNS